MRKDQKPARRIITSQTSVSRPVRAAARGNNPVHPEYHQRFHRGRFPPIKAERKSRQKAAGRRAFLTRAGFPSRG